MVNWFKVFFNIKYFLAVLFLIIMTRTINHSGNIVSMAVYNHYIYIILNVLYIFFSYRRVNIYYEQSKNTIIRIGKKNYEKYNLYLSLISIIFYIVILYSFLIIFFPIPQGYESLLIIFGIIGIFFLLLVEFSIMIRIYYNSGFIFILIPILINFIFHYIIILPLAYKI